MKTIEKQAKRIFKIQKVIHKKELEILKLKEEWNRLLKEIE
jgi:hypothetical protein